MSIKMLEINWRQNCPRSHLARTHTRAYLAHLGRDIAVRQPQQTHERHRVVVLEHCIVIVHERAVALSHARARGRMENEGVTANMGVEYII